MGETKERVNSKASESGKLVAGKADIAESPKRFPSSSRHKQSKSYRPRVRNMLPAEKERSVQLAFPVVEEQTKWLFSAIGSIQNH